MTPQADGVASPTTLRCMSEPIDDKAGVREQLDLESATWVRGEPCGRRIEGAAEVAHILHTDGVTYTVLRKSDDPGGEVLVYNPREWDAFLAGASDGEFDVPEGD